MQELIKAGLEAMLVLRGVVMDYEGDHQEASQAADALEEVLWKQCPDLMKETLWRGK